MGPYSYSSLMLLCRQVTRDNPNLPYPLSPDNILLLSGPFTTSLGTSGRNSRVVLNGKSGAGFVGRREFFYDRLDIGKYFNGITVVFDAAGSSKTYADLLPALNEQYGLGLQATDLANGSTALSNGYTPTPVTLTIASTSPAFTGSLSVQWSRLPAGNYPNSGPGRKAMLIGDMDAGYFGVVRADEMVAALDIFNAVLSDDAGSTPVVNPNLFWMKFAYKGQFLFFPSYHLGTTSWKALYERGSVYDSDGTGKWPPVGSPLTKQNRYIALDSPEGAVGFVPRLPTFAASDPIIGQRAQDGELYQLLGRVFPGTYTKGDWDGLHTATPPLDYSTGFLFQTTSAADGSTVWFTSMNAQSSSNLQKTGNYGWRPFLRLFDLSTVTLALTEIRGTVTQSLRKPTLFIDQNRDPNIPLRMEGVRGTIDRSISKPYLIATDSAPVYSPNSVRGRAPAGVLTPPALQITVVPPVQLKNTNGKLDGFK